MKRMIIIMLVTMILAPGLVMAQENTEPEIPIEQPWTVQPSRTVIWIGEELIVKVNGTANTSYSLQMRPITANNTLRNATYIDWRTTDLNGTDWAVIPDGYNEEPGNYRVQVLINQMAVAYADVRLDYSFERWVEIQFGNVEDYLEYLNRTDQQGLQRDGRMMDMLQEARNEVKILWALVLIMTATMIPIWLGAYKDRCETKKKRSRFIDILEGVEEDRRLYYGGTVTSSKPVRMYGGQNACPDRGKESHDSDKCPHCQLDQWATEMGFAGMTHQQIIDYIAGGKKDKKPKVERPGFFERVALWREYKKSKKEQAKAEKKVAKEKKKASAEKKEDKDKKEEKE